MGNAATKERSTSPHYGSRSRGEASSSRHQYDSRSRSRRDQSDALFGLAGSSREARERDREAEKAAREARRQERERERQREKERSLREESVDGGFLVTHGVYTGPEDFKDKIVRQLIIERRLAPFFKGLRDHEDDWTDAQLYAAVKGLPIPGPDAEPPKEDEPKLSEKSPATDLLTVPIASRSRSQSFTSDGSGNSAGGGNTVGARARSKTLSISSPRNPTLPATTGPQEVNIPSRFVDGRPLEAVLYQNATECPICFLYYPPYFNKTRCCDQEICSECFVQIKRTDPHVPESHDGNLNSEASNSIADQLVSEPATCPFCKQPDFGVTYSPPPFRRGLVYASDSFSGSSDAAIPPPLPTSNPSTPSITTASPESRTSPPLSPSGRRRFILPSSAPEVVTTDQIRPDWAQKLATARAHAARRAAAATALHTAAFILNNNNTAGSSSGGGSYSRRLMRRARENSSNSGHRGDESPSPNNSGAGTPQEGGSAHRSGSLLAIGGGNSSSGRGGNHPDHDIEQNLINLGFIGRRESSRDRTQQSQQQHPAHGGGAAGGRRTRIADLEEMMLMEAIRLSLLEEEERKKKEEEEAQKKAAGDPSSSSSKPPSINAPAAAADIDPDAPTSSAVAGKGKSPERPQPQASASSASSASPAEEQHQQQQKKDAEHDADTLSNFRSLATIITTTDQQEHANDGGDESRRSGLEQTTGEGAGSSRVEAA